MKLDPPEFKVCVPEVALKVTVPELWVKVPELDQFPPTVKEESVAAGAESVALLPIVTAPPITKSVDELEASSVTPEFTVNPVPVVSVTPLAVKVVEVVFLNRLRDPAEVTVPSVDDPPSLVREMFPEVVVDMV